MKNNITIIKNVAQQKNTKNINISPLPDVGWSDIFWNVLINVSLCILNLSNICYFLWHLLLLLVQRVV
jgi:hypothetical protein